MSQSHSTDHEPVSRPPLSPDLEQQILRSIGELAYGVVEVVVHNHQITEIRQTRRTRVADLRLSPTV